MNSRLPLIPGLFLAISLLVGLVAFLIAGSGSAGAYVHSFETSAEKLKSAIMVVNAMSYICAIILLALLFMVYTRKDTAFLMAYRRHGFHLNLQSICLIAGGFLLFTIYAASCAAPHPGAVRLLISFLAIVIFQTALVVFTAVNLIVGPRQD